MKKRGNGKTHTVCCSGQLTAGCEAVCHEPFKEDRVEIRSREVDGCGVSCRSGADNNLHMIPITSRQ